MDADKLTQPVLFKMGDSYYIKIDHDVMQLRDVSCFSDAVECLLKAHYDFNLKYMYELRLVYGFIEKLMGIVPCSIGPSAVLGDFVRSVYV